MPDPQRLPAGAPDHTVDSHHPVFVRLRAQLTRIELNPCFAKFVNETDAALDRGSAGYGYFPSVFFMGLERLHLSLTRRRNWNADRSSSTTAPSPSPRRCAIGCMIPRAAIACRGGQI